MNWMFYLIDLIGNVMEELLAISFMRSVSGNRLKSFRGVITVCVVFTVFRMVLYFTFRNSLMTIAASIVTIAAISLMYNMSRIKRIIFVPIIYILIMFTEAMVGGMLSVITGIPVEEGRNLILFYTAGVLISKMV